MFRDSQTALWEAAALTVGTAVSTNAYDLGALPAAISSARSRDPSDGEAICVCLSVGVSAVTSGGETYEFDIVCADDSALSVNLTILAKYTFTNAQAASILVAGAKQAGGAIILPIPPGSVTRRYLGAQAVLTVGTAAITVTAWITSQRMVQQFKDYGTLIQIL